MKVLLIYPNKPQVATQPPLGLMYIAAVLRKAGHQPWILEGDAQGIRKYFEGKHELAPDFIGITCMSSMYHEIIKIRDYFHEWDVPLIFGGPHATILPDSLLEGSGQHVANYVVMGEGEKTILKIVNGEICHNGDQIIQGERIDDLDSLPFPARDLVNRRYLRHSVSILASRGCPFNCTFCQPTLRRIFGSKVKRRSVRNVIMEIQQCKHDFGIRDFEFFDDTFTADEQWVYDFCEDLLTVHVTWKALSRVDMLNYDLLKAMKISGLTKLSLGIESGSQEILNSYQKGTTVNQNHRILEYCKQLGIKVHGFFMIGAIGETAESIQKTKDFIKNHEFDTIFVTVTTPTPCTRLYDQAEKEGRLLTDWRHFDLLGSLTTTTSPQNPDQAVPMKLNFLSSRDVLKARYNILKSFYLGKLRNPLYLIRFIKNNSLTYTWKAAKNIFHRG